MFFLFYADLFIVTHMGNDKKNRIKGINLHEKKRKSTLSTKLFFV